LELRRRPPRRVRDADVEASGGCLGALPGHRQHEGVRVPATRWEEAVIEPPRWFTSRWANKELAEIRCQPVGISRGTPRFRIGFRYRLARELAPGQEAWALAGDEVAFRAAYMRQLERLGLEAILGRLAGIGREAGGLPLVLLCYEPAGEFCHRHVLSDWLRERGVEIRELELGDLPQRPEAPERRLF
jgi:hypothetical protein